MKKTKNIVALLLIMSLVLLTMSKVFAYSVTLSLVPNVREVKEGGEFTVSVQADNIDAGQGITKIEATLNYDEKVLNTVSETNIEAVNNWKVTYDNFNKKLVAINSQPVKTSGKVFQLSLKTKQTNTNTNSSTVGNLLTPATTPVANTESKNATPLNIELKNIKGSNGLETFQINDVSTTVTVGDQIKQNTQPVPTAPAPVANVATQPVVAPAVPVKEEKLDVANKPINKAGVEDAQLVLMITLAGVATLSLISLARLNKK